MSLMWEISPRLGVGPLHFGDSHERIRSSITGPKVVFRRSAWSASLTEHYEDHGLLVEMRDDVGALSFEMAAPSRPRLQGIDLLGQPAEQVLQRITAAGMVVERTSDGWNLVAEGVSLFPTAAADSGAPLVGVSVFEHGVPPEPVFLVGGGSGLGSVVATSEGLGHIGFESSRSSIREQMSICLVSFDGCFELDHFPEDGLTVSYDEEGRRVQVVATGPAIVEVAGHHVLGRRYGEVLDILQDAGHACEERVAELWVADLGVSLWTARHGDPNLTICAIAVTQD